MTKLNTQKVVTAILVSVGISSIASAHKESDELVVIGRHAGQQLSGLTSDYEYLDLGLLEIEGRYDLNSALLGKPGIVLSNNVQQGGTYGVRFRGLRPEDTLLRIDGVRVTRRASNMLSVLGGTSTAGFSSLEIYKGGQAAVFGSHANGGVIALTTASGKDRDGGSLLVEAGSFNTLTTRLEQYGSSGKFNYYFFAEGLTTDNDTFGGNSESATRDNDHVKFTTGLRLGYDISDDLSLGLTFRRVDSDFETAQGGGSRTQFEHVFTTAYLDYQITHDWRSKLTFSAFFDDTDFNTGPADYDQFGVTWENSLHLSDTAVLNFGYEYENHDFRNRVVNGFSKDHYNAVYVNYAQEFDQLAYSLGARYEDYQTFGSEVSWQGGFSYTFAETGTKLGGHVGTGFITPTLVQLYGPGFGAFGGVGNPSLDPETTFGWDFGIEQELSENHAVAVTFFETDVTDRISFGPVLFNDTNAKSKASGVEVSLKGKFSDALKYQLAYTWLDDSFAGQPEQAASAQMSYQVTDDWTVGLGAEYLDQRSYGGAPLDDAFIARAFTSYQWSEQIQLTARIENLTDTEYELVDFSNFGDSVYPAKRLGVYLGAKVQW